MLHHHFPQLISPFHDGFVSGRDIAQFVRANPATKAITSHQAPPPAPTIRGREILTSILIRDPIARIRASCVFERWQEYDLPGGGKGHELDFKGYVEWRLKTTSRVVCNFHLHFCRRSSTTSELPLNALELQEAIVALDAVDSVGTVERYDEWLALAQSFLATRFDGISLPLSHLNALVTERHRLPEPAIVGAGATSERAITI